MKWQSRGVGSITKLVEPIGRGPQRGPRARSPNRRPGSEAEPSTKVDYSVVMTA